MNIAGVEVAAIVMANPGHAGTKERPLGIHEDAGDELRRLQRQHARNMQCIDQVAAETRDWKKAYRAGHRGQGFLEQGLALREKQRESLDQVSRNEDDLDALMARLGL